MALIGNIVFNDKEFKDQYIRIEDIHYLDVNNEIEVEISISSGKEFPPYNREVHYFKFNKNSDSNLHSTIYKELSELFECSSEEV